SVLLVVGDHPGTAVGTEDAIEPLVRTCFGVRTVGEALGASAQHGEIRVGDHHPCCHLCAGRSLAIRAVTVCGQGWLGIEPVRHLATGTVTRVLLAHFFLRFGEKETLRAMPDKPSRPETKTTASRRYGEAMEIQ